jgi:hypothetical protein
MNIRILGLAVALSGLSLPASGGIVLREVRVTESADEEARGRQVSQIWVEGGKMRALFEESTNALMPAGSYLLAPGGDAMYLVNPSRETITRMDMVEMEAIGEKDQPAAGKRTEARTSMEVMDVRLEQHLDEPGPTMLGYPTRHYRYELTYNEKQHMTGTPGPADTRVREQHEFWATAALKDEPALPAIRAYRLAAPERGPGQPELREANTRLHAHGFFLKHILERTVASDINIPIGGVPANAAINDSSRERITVEVTELRHATLPLAGFELPEGYAETEFFAPAGTPEPTPDLEGRGL